MIKNLALIFLLPGMMSCSPARFVKPLAKKQQAIAMSFGGPLIKMDKNIIPMPFISVAYGYGIDSSLTGFGSVNITSALYGNLQVELGITKQVFKQNRFLPGISITPVCNFMYRDNDASKIYPQLDIYTFWEYGKRKNCFYTGISNWFELAKTRSLEQKQENHWLLTPVVGHTFTNRKWNINVEAKIIAPNLSNEKMVVDYQTPFKNHGAFGVYFGYTRKF